MKQQDIILVNQETDGSATQQTQSKDAFMSFVPLLLIFGIFYFFMIRPQMKKQKEQKDLISSAKRGDKVVVAGGIIGTIIKEKDADVIVVEIAKNSNIEVLKSTIGTILNRTVAKSDTTKNKKDKKS
jgi:preprotein translocase subunit YajC